MRRILICIVLLTLLLPGIASAAEKPISLIINGKRVTEGASPIIVNSSTYIPLKNLFQNISFSVDYIPATKSVTVYYLKGPFKMSFTINSNIVEVDSTYVDGGSVNRSISNNIIAHKGAVYVPLRAFAELLGADVLYEPTVKTVYFNITDSNISQSIYPYIGVVPTETTPEQPVQPPAAPSEERVSLTAKQIGTLANHVGYVISFDKNQHPVSQGSGFLISDWGLFVTNNHVADSGGGLKIYVNGEIYDTYGEYLFDNSAVDVFGVIIAKKENKDETGMIVKYDTFPYLNYRTDLPEIGDKVYAIGSPKGFENSLSEGIVSSIRNYDGYILIQHTADIDHGSSGGVLLNEYGEAIGITSAGVEGTQIEFAIPMMYVQKELDAIPAK